MHLLYLTEDVPNRDPKLGDGSSMIPFELLRALPAEVQVRLLTFDRGVPVPSEVEQRCDRVVVLPLEDVESGRLKSLLRVDDAAATARTNPRSRAAVAELSAAADATLVHGPHVLPLVQAVVGPVVVQTVDPWSAALDMIADGFSGLQRLYWRRRAWHARAAERRLPPGARLLTVGAQDARRWSAAIGRPVGSVSNGVELHPRLRVRKAGEAPVLCFVGSLHYLPNVDSARRLVEQVAPLVWQSRPEARVLVAGRMPMPEVLALAGPRVEVRGNVATVAEVFDASDVAIFPDRYGVGVRNSVQEALAAALPVVASSAAARELPDHPLLRVRDSDREIADAALELLAADPDSVAGAAVPALRTWQDAAAEYLDQIERAIAGK